LEYLLDRLERQQYSGGGIGVGEDDAAILTPIVPGTDSEVFRQWQCLGFDSVQPAVDRIEAVADVRYEYRFVMLEQRVEDVRQYLIRAVADKYLRRHDAIIPGDGFFQFICIRRGIQTQRIVQLTADGLDHPGRGSVGVLVGIEFDQII